VVDQARDAELSIQARLVDLASPALDALIAKVRAAGGQIQASLAGATSATPAAVVSPEVFASLARMEDQIGRLVAALATVQFPPAVAVGATGAAVALGEVSAAAGAAGAAVSRIVPAATEAATGVAAVGAATVEAGAVGGTAMLELQAGVEALRVSEQKLVAQTLELTAGLGAAQARAAALEAEVARLHAASTAPPLAGPAGATGGGAGILGLLGSPAAIAGLAVAGVAIGGIVSAASKLTAQLDASVERSGKFGLAMAQVATIAGKTAEEIEALRGALVRVAVEQGTSPLESAEGFYLAVSSGIEASAKGVEFFAQANKLAVATLSESKVAVDVLTSAINAYGFEISEAARLSDVLFKTVELGKVLLPDLAAELGQVFPIAAQLGISFEEVNAAVVTLTQAGLTAGEATTQARAGLVALLRNIEAIRAAFAAAGQEFDIQSIRTLGMAGTFTALRDAVEGDEEALVSLLGRVEAVNFLLGITGKNADRFAAAIKGVQEQGGTERAFELVKADDVKRGERAINALNTVLDETFGRAKLAAIAEFQSQLHQIAGLDFKSLRELSVTLRGLGIEVGRSLSDTVRVVRDLADAISDISEEVGGRGLRSIVENLLSIESLARLAVKPIADLGNTARAVSTHIRLIGIASDDARPAIDRVAAAVAAMFPGRVLLNAAQFAIDLLFEFGAEIVQLSARVVADITRNISSSARSMALVLQPLSASAAAVAGAIAESAEKVLRVAEFGPAIADGLRASKPDLLAAVVRVTHEAFDRADTRAAVDHGKKLGTGIAGGVAASINAALNVSALLGRTIAKDVISDADLNEAQRRVRVAITELALEAKRAGGEAQLPSPVAKALEELRSLAENPVRFNLLTEISEKTEKSVSTIELFTRALRASEAQLLDLFGAAAEGPIDRAEIEVERLRERVEATIRELSAVGVPQQTLDAIAGGLGAAIEKVRQEGRDAVAKQQAEVIGDFQALIDKAREADEAITRARADALAGVLDLEAETLGDTAKRVADVESRVGKLVSELEQFRDRRAAAFDVTEDELSGIDALIERAIAAGIAIQAIEVDDGARREAEALAESVEAIARAAVDSLPPVMRGVAGVAASFETSRLAAERLAEEQTRSLGLAGDAAEQLRNRIVDAAEKAQQAAASGAAFDLVLTPEIEIEEQFIEAELIEKIGPALEEFTQQFNLLLKDGLSHDEFERIKADLRALREEAVSVQETIRNSDAAFAAGFSSTLSDRVRATFDAFADGAKLAGTAFDSFGSGLGDAIADVVLGLKSGKDAMREFVRAFVADIARAISQIIAFRIASQALGLFGIGGGGTEIPGPGQELQFAHGGVMPGKMLGAGVAAFAYGGVMDGRMIGRAGSLPIRAYDFGGVATSPQMALFGEGPGAEAFVPLPGPGRGIPVEFTGGGGRALTVQVTYAPTIQALDGESARNVLVREARVIGDIVAEQVVTNSHRGLSQAVNGRGDSIRT
jgi:TP901 family phage tail tape measure protein